MEKSQLLYFRSFKSSSIQNFKQGEILFGHVIIIFLIFVLHLYDFKFAVKQKRSLIKNKI